MTEQILPTPFPSTPDAPAFSIRIWLKSNWKHFAVLAITSLLIYVTTGKVVIPETPWPGEPIPAPARGDNNFLSWDTHIPVPAKIKASIIAELKRAGYDGRIAWRGNDFAAQIGRGKLLCVRGTIRDDGRVIVTRCSGTYGDDALEEIRAVLREIYPGGEVVTVPD